MADSGGSADGDEEDGAAPAAAAPAKKNRMAAVIVDYADRNYPKERLMVKCFAAFNGGEATHHASAWLPNGGLLINGPLPLIELIAQPANQTRLRQAFGGRARAYVPMSAKDKKRKVKEQCAEKVKFTSPFPVDGDCVSASLASAGLMHDMLCVFPSGKVGYFILGTAEQASDCIAKHGGLGISCELAEEGDCVRFRLGIGVFSPDKPKKLPNEPKKKKLLQRPKVLSAPKAKSQPVPTVVPTLQRRNEALLRPSTPRQESKKGNVQPNLAAAAAAVAVPRPVAALDETHAALDRMKKQIAELTQKLNELISKIGEKGAQAQALAAVQLAHAGGQNRSAAAATSAGSRAQGAAAPAA